MQPLLTVWKLLSCSTWKLLMLNCSPLVTCVQHNKFLHRSWSIQIAAANCPLSIGLHMDSIRLARQQLHSAFNMMTLRQMISLLNSSSSDEGLL